MHKHLKGWFQWMGWAAVALSACLSAQAQSTNATQTTNANPWKTTAGINLSIARGNSDTILAGATIASARKWDKNEVSLGADATYGENKDLTSNVKTTTAQNFGGFGQYNRLITDRWYFGGHLDGRQDRIANIMYRFTLAPSTGYYFIKNKSITLSGEVGPGLIFESLRDSTTGVDSASSYWTLRFAEKFNWKINERATLMQDLEFLPRPDRFSDFALNDSIVLDTKITKKLSTRITLQDFYRSDPAPGRKDNDLRLLAGLTYTF